jgi:hypothetical protein
MVHTVTIQATSMLTVYLLSSKNFLNRDMLEITGVCGGGGGSGGGRSSANSVPCFRPAESD